MKNSGTDILDLDLYGKVDESEGGNWILSKIIFQIIYLINRFLLKMIYRYRRITCSNILLLNTNSTKQSHKSIMFYEIVFKVKRI